MNILFKTISNKKYELLVPQNASVKGLKDGLAAKYHFNSDQIKLIYHSKVLENDDQIKDLDFSPESYIVLYVQTFFAKSNQRPIVPIYSPGKGANPFQGFPEENHIDHNVQNTSSDSDDNSPISSSKTPSTEPLPELFNTSYDDPPNFQQNVAKLQSLGFPKNESEYAYRSSFYNLNIAADYLLSGFIPDPISINNNQTNKQTNFDSHEDKDKAEEEEEFNEAFEYDDNITETPQTLTVELIRNYLSSHPNEISGFISALQANNPEIAHIFKNNPERFVANLGLNPRDFDFSSLREKSEYELLMEQFTEEEQNAIHRLEKEGFDTMIILQVYAACDKNEEETLNCLKSM